MLLFNPSRQDVKPHVLAASPTRIFVNGAVKALSEAPPQRQNLILEDLADQIDCDRDALSFLISPPKSAADIDIAVPDFSAALMG
jgi:hypothetical protein